MGGGRTDREEELIQEGYDEDEAIEIAADEDGADRWYGED